MVTSQPFREFFLKEDIDFNSLSDETIIVFDTNTLLNIYRYSDSTKEKLISAIDKVKNNIWIPYQVGLEFNMNRRVVLREMRDEKNVRINNLRDKIEECQKFVENEINHFNLKSTDVQEHKKDAIDYVKEGFKELVDGLSNKLEEINKLMTLDEDLADTIANLFEGKIGESYTQEEIDEKLSDAEKRYENEIPPGYKDKKRKNGEYEKTFYNGVEFEKRFGDLIVWYQIIDKATEDNIKKVVFVTNDNKPDWWYSVKGETIGPRVELKNEILRIANADLIMLNANSFLNNFSETNDLIIIDSQDENNGLPKGYLTDNGEILLDEIDKEWLTIPVSKDEELRYRKTVEALENIVRMAGIDRDHNRRINVSNKFETDLKRYMEQGKSQLKSGGILDKLDNERREYLRNKLIQQEIEELEEEMTGLSEKERREYLINKFNL